MPDVFDQLAAPSQQTQQPDVFDHIAAATSAQPDVFDHIAADQAAQTAAPNPTQDYGAVHNFVNSAVSSLDPLSNLLIRGAAAVGAVDPQKAQAAMANQPFPNDPNRLSGVLGNAAGSTVQAVLAPEAAPYTFAASGGEQGAEKVEAARASGQNVSNTQAATDVIGQAALQFVMGKLAPGGKANAAILDRTPILAGAVADAVKNIAISTGVHVGEAEAQNIASNALTKYTGVNPNQGLTEGAGNAAIQGAVMGGGGQLGAEAVQAATPTPNEASPAAAPQSVSEPEAAPAPTPPSVPEAKNALQWPTELSDPKAVGDWYQKTFKQTPEDSAGIEALTSMSPGKYVLRDVPIDSVNSNQLTGDEASPDKVARFASQPSDTQPPIIAIDNGGGLSVADGGHRLAAAIARGDTTIPAYVPESSEFGKQPEPEPESAVQKPTSEEHEQIRQAGQALADTLRQQTGQAGLTALKGQMQDLSDKQDQQLANRQFKPITPTATETPTEAPAETPTAASPKRSILSDESGATNMHKTFLERNVLPAAKNVLQNAKETWTNVNRYLGTGLGETPEETGVKGRVRAVSGSLERQQSQTETRFTPARTAAGKLDQPTRDALVDKMEGKGGTIADPVIAKAASDLTKIAAKNQSDATAAGIDASKWDMNYVGHLFKWPEGSQGGKKSIAGPETYLKSRVYDTYADALKSVRASGGDATYKNPIDMAIAKQVEVRKSIEARNLVNDEIKRGNITELSPGKGLPDGMKYLDDKLARSNGKRLVAPEAIANTMNQMIAPGLKSSIPIWDNITALKRATTALNFSLSAWHIPIETMRNAGLQVGLAADNAFHGEGSLALQNLSKALPWNQAKFGGDVRAAASSIGPVTPFEPVIKAATDAGASFKGRSVLQPSAFSKAVEDYKAQDPIAAGGHLLQAIGEKVSSPIMNKFVPALKAGYLANLAETYIKRGITGDDLTAKMRQGVDNANNVLGQVTRSNQFQHRVVQDLMDGVFSAPKFVEGDIRSGGAFARDVIKGVHALATGQKPELTPAITTFLGHAITQATMGAAVQMAYSYATSGKVQYPTSLKDLFMPRTGRKNEDGSDERIMLPTGFSLFTSLASEGPAKTFENRIAPVWRAMGDVIKNSDYRNEQVFDPKAAIGEQVKAGAEHVGKSLLPFSMQGLAEQPTGQELSPDLKAASFAGIRKASPRESQSPAEAKAHDLLSQHYPDVPRTAEEVDRHDAVAKLAGQWRDKTPGYHIAMRDAIKAGTIQPDDVANIKDKAQQKPGLLGVVQRGSFQPSELMDIWRLASDDEKSQINYLVRNRINESTTISRSDKLNYIREMKGLQ